MNPGAAKLEIRARVRARLSLLSPEARRQAADAVMRRIRDLPEWDRARIVLLTWPLPDEIPVAGLVRDALDSGRTVGLPAWSESERRYVVRRVGDPDRELGVGPYGVREPLPGLPELPVAGLDLAVVPGIAFGRSGERVGRGKGFYDRLLVPFTGTACGIAFEQQLVEEPPVEPHDVLMNLVVTPSSVFRAGKSR